MKFSLQMLVIWVAEGYRPLLCSGLSLCTSWADHGSRELIVAQSSDIGGNADAQASGLPPLSPGPGFSLCTSSASAKVVCRAEDSNLTSTLFSWVYGSLLLLLVYVFLILDWCIFINLLVRWCIPLSRFFQYDIWGVNFRMLLFLRLSLFPPVNSWMGTELLGHIFFFH